MNIDRRHALIGAAATLLPVFANAQAMLPDTMRIVMPFPAGNALDASARWFAESYRTVTGRNAIVENKPGAASTIAAGEVSRGRPDGSVLLFTTAGHLTTAVLMKSVPYDPIESFTPVSAVSMSDGFALITRAASPFNSVQDVVDAAKKNPGKVSFASSGNGSTPHVVGALFSKSAGVDLLHVPYRGDSLTDLIAGVTDMIFVGPAVVRPLIDSGKLKVLGITGTKRAPTFPNVPTFAEAGVRDVDLPAYSILLGPPNMSPAVLAVLNQGIVKTLTDPTLAAKFKSTGAEPWMLPPDQFKSYLRADLKRFQTALPPLGIQMDL